MALSHYRNSHAAVNKWEVVNPSLFEVHLMPPDLPGQNNEDTQVLLLEHVRSIGGLDGLTHSIGMATQKFKYAERHYAGGPESTHLELSITFSLNLNSANENYIYTTLRKWYDKVWNPANGAMGLKVDYTGELVILEYNRDGSIWRKITCSDCFPTGQPTGMGDRSYDDPNAANELTVQFIADVWDEQVVGLPVYEASGIDN